MAEITEDRLRKILEGSYCGFGEGVAAAVKLVAVRADLREAMELLRAASPNMGDAEWDEWGSKANKLLFKDNNNT